MAKTLPDSNIVVLEAHKGESTLEVQRQHGLGDAFELAPSLEFGQVVVRTVAEVLHVAAKQPRHNRFRDMEFVVRPDASAQVEM